MNENFINAKKEDKDKISLQKEIPNVIKNSPEPIVIISNVRSQVTNSKIILPHNLHQTDLTNGYQIKVSSLSLILHHNCF